MVLRERLQGKRELFPMEDVVPKTRETTSTFTWSLKKEKHCEEGRHEPSVDSKRTHREYSSHDCCPDYASLPFECYMDVEANRKKRSRVSTLDSTRRNSVVRIPVRDARRRPWTRGTTMKIFLANIGCIMHIPSEKEKDIEKGEKQRSLH